MTSRRSPRWLLVLLLFGMPLLELVVLIRVGQVIGAWWTIGLLVAASVVGGWLIRREGTKAWRGFTTSLQSGRLPTTELADGALIVLAGALMLSPGFVTDVFALFLIFPVTRPAFRSLLGGFLATRLPMPGSGSARPRNARHPGPPTDGQVIRGEVIDP